jgi:hypothetical protein
MNRNGLLLYIFLVILVCVSGCKKDNVVTEDGKLSFSSDTVTFDTVFTTLGSATLSFKIYNHGSSTLRIRSISLAGAEHSFFHLNIDGESTRSMQNVDVPPDDSLFIFVAVTVDPLNSDNPLVVKDSVLFNINGRISNVKLIAYGQDVNLINGKIFGSITWTRNKPYLIYNSMAVDTASTLTIEAGTQIYFHKNSSMIIWGRLLVNGTAEDPVVFQNDRLEEFYRIIAGQWGTIYIDPISTGNVINHAIIKNSIAGIQIGFPSDYNVPELELSNSIIQNVSFAGIYAFGANITCYNTVIADCAGAATALLRGGSYRFMQCTVSNNGVLGSSRSNPSVVITNFFNNPEYDQAKGDYVYVLRTGDLTEATFSNCIIYGNIAHEFQLANNQTNLFNYKFDHCLVKASEDSINVSDIAHYNDLIFNKKPEFANDSDRYHLDFSLDTLSPAQNAGDPQLPVTFPFLENDITGSSRLSDGKPDLGAYERKEEQIIPFIK